MMLRAGRILERRKRGTRRQRKKGKKIATRPALPQKAPRATGEARRGKTSQIAACLTMVPYLFSPWWGHQPDSQGQVTHGRCPLTSVQGLLNSLEMTQKVLRSNGLPVSKARGKGFTDSYPRHSGRRIHKVRIEFAQQGKVLYHFTLGARLPAQAVFS